ncbi:MAG: complex I subunit 5 family protein, partial [Bacillota bacterium]
MIYLIIYPLLTAFILGIIKKHIKPYSDLLVLGSFSMYVILTAKITAPALTKTLTYQVGSWANPLGIGLQLNAASLFMVWLIIAITYLVLIYCSVYINRAKIKYYTLILILTAGLMGLVLTNDFFNLYVFFEITAIVSYALAAVNKERDTFEGVLKYLVIGSLGSVFILLAIILSYQLTGSLNLGVLGTEFTNLSYLQKYSILTLLLIGFGSKIPLVPLHAWMPDVYNCSNVSFNVLSSALIINTVLYSLMRIIYQLFTLEFFSNSAVQLIVIYWGVLTFIVAHLLAYQQQNIKRLLAYSSIAHMGYLVVAFSLASAEGIIAANFHLLNHALMKSSLFFISGLFALAVKSYDLKDWQGLAYQSPYLTTLFSLSAFAIIGLPPFNGFISKWLMVKEIIVEGYYSAAFLLLIGTILSLIYYLKVIRVLYQKSEIKKKVEKNNLLL